jgi:hypothetical protein
MTDKRRRAVSWEEREIRRAASEAARIGGRAGDEELDPAKRPLVEAGEGVSEGFELAEDDLIDAIETGGGIEPEWYPFASEGEDAHATVHYAEADHEDSSERVDGDR